MRFVRLVNADPIWGRGDGGLWMKSDEIAELDTAGVRIEHDGKSGIIVRVDNLGPGGSTVALVDWDGVTRG